MDKKYIALGIVGGILAGILGYVVYSKTQQKRGAKIVNIQVSYS